MSGEQTLSLAFATARGESRTMLDVDDELERVLERAHADGQRAHPGFVVESTAFVRHIGERISADASVETIAALAASDLYLACGCLAGNDVAIAAFDAVVMREVEIALRRLRASSSEVDTLRQLVRERLLWGNEGARPRLAEYTGRGNLVGWVRVTAVRLGINQLRSQKREQGRRDELAALIPPVVDPQLALLRAQYGTEIKEAFEQALQSLSGREKTLLRMSFFDGMSVDAIGDVFRVHRSSAARWIAAARQRLLDETRRMVMERLASSGPDVDSLLRLIDGDLEVSIRRRLDSGAG